MQLKRLFDCIEYQLSNFPKECMLSAKTGGTWEAHSTQYVKNIVNALSAGLLHLGIGGHDFTVESADKVAIISNNRPEWIIADMAVQQTGAILVPVYPTTSAAELEFIFNDAEVKIVFVSDGEMLDKVLSISCKISSIKKIYTFDEVGSALHWKTLLSTNAAFIKDAEHIAASISPDHVATIIYTSGTTGTPKGVMLTHANIYANVMFSKESFPFPDNPAIKVLSFLPLNHIFEKMVTYIFLFSGISIYYAESLETIGDNLKEIKPDGFTTVPRLLEKVFEKIMAKGSQLKGIKRMLFFRSAMLGEQFDNNSNNKSIWYKMQLAIANRLVFSKWRKALGGNISFIITGGAACQVKLLRIFNAAKIPVYEGYGPTENSPVISVNRKFPKSDTKFGTVGPPINGIKVRLADDGEILVKGPTVMKGYYKREDLTNEVLVNDWLHTGDIGTWVDEKYLKITDRKKELFKTSGGKYVAPQPIENKLKESKFIEQVMVVGSEKKFVAALIVPAFSAVKEWMQEHHITFGSDRDIIKNEQLIQLFTEVINEFNTHFNHVEQIKKFALMPVEWSIEAGEMTPKMSVKRKVIAEKYQIEIENIYK